MDQRQDHRQYGFDFGLWTRQIVAELIGERFGVELQSRQRWKAATSELNLTPQKATHAALMSVIRQRSRPGSGRSIRSWQHERKTRERRFASGMNPGFRADAVHGRTWGVKGHTPVIEVAGNRQSVSAASAVNAKGAFLFVTYKGGMTAELFVSGAKAYNAWAAEATLFYSIWIACQPIRRGWSRTTSCQRTASWSCTSCPAMPPS